MNTPFDQNSTRDHVAGLSGRSFARCLPILAGLAWCSVATAAELYVSPAGSDTNPGTKAKPFATIAHARDVVRDLPQRAKEPVRVILRGGVYRLPATLVFTVADSGAVNAPVEYRSADGETAVISGGQVITGLKWEPCTNGILQARVPAGFQTDQLFVNDEQMPMARYPDFDKSQRIFNGVAADAFSDERAARWQNPAGGFMHAMHNSHWGGMHYVITGKDASGKLTYEGGWQNNRPSEPHNTDRFVENIFEELDAPGEWFLNPKTATLYFYPPAGLNLAKATWESVRLKHLVEFRGTEQQPVRFVTLQGLSFRHAARTFMENKERMLRTDWTVYRGGAVFLTGTEDCRITDCVIDHVGGNALFVNNYHRGLLIRGCHIFQAGGNGIAFVGDPAAVRNGLVGYSSRASFADIDKAPGPKTPNYPADSRVEDCLIHEIGRTEKQVAGVEIDMAMNITVSHCSIYDMPRAGVNIGDGCWGGHVIEFCDVFDTVLETGDHGSFNSWGRDRFWGLKDIDLDTVTLGENRNLPLLDVIHPIILRNNRWRCDHGWDIDLDDGSSNYDIRNNLCLSGGLKNREGFYRVVENNVVVDNSLHPHVWYGNSQDIFRRNIVLAPYRPIRVKAPWGRECDFNLLHQPGVKGEQPATVLQKESGLDQHSIVADALFVDAARGDYRVKEGSPALALGFKNFPMDQFGVTSAGLRRLARAPVLPVPGVAREEESKRDARVTEWLGAKVKNVIGLGEVSAAGLPGEIGVSLVEVPAGSAAAKAKLEVGDVILGCAGQPTDSVAALQRRWRRAAAGTVRLEVWRGQKSVPLDVSKEQ
jgi:hypothetical protein